MKLLVACETSGIVRSAFAARGHEAMSCDLQPSKLSGPHYTGDARDLLALEWDAMIAHPPCTYLTNASTPTLHAKDARERWLAMYDAADFFNLFRFAGHIRKRCIENPIMHPYAAKLCGPPTQVIHPWMFGDPFIKKTGLWLINLPPLRPTHKRSDYPDGVVQNWSDTLGQSKRRRELRSQTYSGIALAMAKQWG